jgi:hypothetical protein
MITVYGANIQLPELRRVQLKTPSFAGKWWRGIQHGELVDTLLERIGKRGWTPGDMQFSLGSDGADLAGAIDLDAPGLAPPDGTRLGLGLMTSNAQHHSLRLYVGATVMVCHNGMATGEIVLCHKHTINFRLKEEIDFALEDYEFHAGRMNQMTERLKQRELSPTEAEHSLMEAGRNGLMAWSRIGAVDREYRKPRFAEIGTGTSWALLNAFTYVSKRSSPMRQLENINRFRELLPAEVPGRVLSTTEVVENN